MSALQGQRAVVTAGASGIGRVVARTLANAGALVAVCDVDESRLLAFEAENPRIAAYRCDVGDAAKVEAVYATIVEALGGIDILVNNVGIAGPTGVVETSAPADWDRTVVVNLSAQFYFTRLAVPAMREQRHGSIINMSSAAGRLGFPYRSPLRGSEMGRNRLHQSLAMELGADNIRVNTILPGSVKGERMDAVIARRAAMLGTSETEIRADEIKNISMKRMIDPQEIVDLIVFISSDAGRSISGQSLGICGNTEILR